MINDDNKTVYDDIDSYVNDVSSNDGILDLDVPERKTIKKTNKKATKKTSRKKVNEKKASKKTNKTKTSKASVKKSIDKKTATKRLTSKKKITKKAITTIKKDKPKNIEDEFLKITNIKSVEQVKKPKRIAFMISFYAVIVIALIVFCLIKFSKPNKNNLLLEETINYEYLTEEAVTTTKKIIEESSSDIDDIGINDDASIDEDIYANDEETSVEESEKETETTNRLLELTTKSANLYNEPTRREETIKNVETTKKEETTKKVETTKKEETTKKQVETTKMQIEATEAIVTKAWPVRTNINELLPRYKEVIYPYSIYNQMTTEEIGIINSSLSSNYNTIKDKVFGEAVTFANKGTNGIIYLNYTYLQEYMETYANGTKQNYERLPVAPYYNYIMNDKFNFDYKTYTTNLKMRLDFKQAKNQGEYFEVPATIFEPVGASISSGGYRKINVRVLKKAKIGYTESFSLTALLEVLDIECNTKHNPFFNIEDVIGVNPKVLTDMSESGFDVRSMIDEEIFNYVLFDKKGYIMALYTLKS